MEYDPAFIGLEWIEMVDKLVGEVDRRSPKGGSRAQMALVSRDKGVAKPSFEKLRENLSFFTFYHGHHFFLTKTEWWQRRTTPWTKGKGGAIAYFQYIIGGAEESIAHWLKGRSSARFSYADLMSGSIFSLHNLGLRENIEVWDLITCWWWDLGVIECPPKEWG